jgi:arginyl-tRNA synthetase
VIQLRLAAEIRAAIGRAQADGALPDLLIPPFELERPKVREHGDWSCGIAMVLARPAAMKPRDVATAIVDALGLPEHVASVEIAGPGFINLTLSHAWLCDIVREVEGADAAWGRTQSEEPVRINVEFVSANPTGPMHLGHGRWAAIGDTLARLLRATGHDVATEFYVNDHGRQMVLFGRSIAVRYLEHFGRDGGEIPEGGYVGDYVRDLAADIAKDVGDRFLDVPEDERVEALQKEGATRMLASQRAALASAGVEFDTWFSEETLHEADAVRKAIGALTEAGHTFEAEGATWLRTTTFGDDKDRVLVRSTDGEPAYPAVDVAYFLNKIDRGFQHLIYLLGADHHGWVRRTHAAFQALGLDPAMCEVLLGQFVHLVRGSETVSMSKRQGEGVSFETLIDEVGRDAARYHFLRVSMDQTVNFDLDVVVAQTQENPVYYVQYAHARICSIIAKAAEESIALAPVDEVVLDELQHTAETELLHKIAEFPEAVEIAARLRAPHRITRYAEDLASLFHAFYRDCRVITEDASLTQARLHLAEATRITLRNALELCGVSAPERM